MRRYRDYRSFLEETYGKKVYRIGVDGGFSCPNRDKEGRGGCIYCDGTGSKAAYQRREESDLAGTRFNEKASERLLLSSLSLKERECAIRDQIARGKEFVMRRYGAEAFGLYFQAWTNTYAPVEELRDLYGDALSTGTYVEFIVSTRPDEIDGQKADMLASFQNKDRKVWVELGLQSANDRTLSAINRGHDVACWQRACRLLHQKGLSVCVHVIFGLPGEGRDDYLHTAQVIARAGVEAVKIHNLDICGGTALLDRFLDGEISVPSAERHLESVVLFLRHIPSTVVVERLLCETPSHRLASPVSFGNKNRFLSQLEEMMEAQGVAQGDLYEG